MDVALDEAGRFSAALRGRILPGARICEYALMPGLVARGAGDFTGYYGQYGEAQAGQVSKEAARKSINEDGSGRA